jgi:hypothetical protein
MESQPPPVENQDSAKEQHALAGTPLKSGEDEVLPDARWGLMILPERFQQAEGRSEKRRNRILIGPEDG